MHCEAECLEQHSWRSGALEVAAAALQRTISQLPHPLYHTGAGPGASCSWRAPVDLRYPSP